MLPEGDVLIHAGTLNIKNILKIIFNLFQIKNKKKNIKKKAILLNDPLQKSFINSVNFYENIKTSNTKY